MFAKRARSGISIVWQSRAISSTGTSIRSFNFLGAEALTMVTGLKVNRNFGFACSQRKVIGEHFDLIRTVDWRSRLSLKRL